MSDGATYPEGTTTKISFFRKGKNHFFLLAASLRKSYSFVTQQEQN